MRFGATCHVLVSAVDAWGWFVECRRGCVMFFFDPLFDAFHILVRWRPSCCGVVSIHCLGLCSVALLLLSGLVCCRCFLTLNCCSFNPWVYAPRQIIPKYCTMLIRARWVRICFRWGPIMRCVRSLCRSPAQYGRFLLLWFGSRYRNFARWTSMGGSDWRVSRCSYCWESLSVLFLVLFVTRLCCCWFSSYLLSVPISLSYSRTGFVSGKSFDFFTLVLTVVKLCACTICAVDVPFRLIIAFDLVAPGLVPAVLRF